MQELKDRLNKAQRRYDTLNGQYQHVTQQVQKTQTAIQSHKEAITVLEETQKLLQHLQHLLVDESLKEIEGLITDALQEVFPDQKLSFSIQQKIERGRTSLDFTLLDHRTEPPVQADIIDAFGGGPVAVVSFLLRVIAIKKLNLYPFLALDESFSQVSAQYVPNVAKMVRKLAERLGLKILLVTHQEGFLEGAHKALIASPDTTKGMVLKAEDAL